MSDIDFEELDKAVNSLMGSPAAEASVTTAVAPQPTDSPVTQAETPAETSQEGSVSAPSATPLAKRRGRFMDVVHPSSDMKLSMPTKAPSREGVTIAAPGETGVPSDMKETDATAVNTDTGVTTPETVSAPAVAPEWPDPIDMHGGVPDEDEAKTDEEPSLAEPMPAELPASEPLSSPFLSDAKVEKRPLGGATESGKTPENDDSSSNVAAQMNDALAGVATMEKLTETDTPAETVSESRPEPESVPLPAELASDLVAIEAGDVTTHAPAEPTEEASIESSSASDEPATTEEPNTPLMVEKEKEAIPAPSVVAAATPALGSIVQQYKEEPSSGDETHAAIYDTDTDVAPLVHLTKKKTGWLYVVLIVLVLLLGAGGGAAVYFLHLI